MLKGMQEQQQKIDSLTTKLNTKDSLQDARLTALENMLNHVVQTHQLVMVIQTSIN